MTPVARGNAIWVTFIVLVIIYTRTVSGAMAVLRSMARRWREETNLDLPTPYSSPPARARR